MRKPSSTRCCRSRSAPSAGPPPVGATAAPTEPTRPRRRRKRTVAFAVVGLGVLLALAIGLRWVSRPAQVAGLLLDRAGSALGLQITSSGIAEYNLRGTPRLVVRDIVVRRPGATSTLLTAERVELSLPWSTLRARGADLTVRRIEIDAPVLDLHALQEWLDSRPPSGETRIPTLTDGLQVTRGRVIGDGWSLDRVTLDLPSFAPDRAVAARVAGRLLAGDVSVPFDLQLALTRPTLSAGLGVAGIATVITPDWRMPMQLQLSGRLHEGDDGIGLDRFRLGGRARHVGTDREVPFVVGLAGSLRYLDGRLQVRPLGLALRGDDMVPTLRADGSLEWQTDLALELRGELARWPDAWPALPSPLDEVQSEMQFGLRYRGPLTLAGATTLRLERDDTRFEARLRLPRILEWIDQLEHGTPLPPLDGTLVTPRLEISGATLEGVEIEFDDGKEAP